MPAMSQGQPARWTGMMPRVRGVIRGAMVSGVMFWLSASTSAKTGTPPASSTQAAEATKLRGVTITSSPGCRSSARRAASSVTVPFAMAMAWAVPT